MNLWYVSDILLLIGVMPFPSILFCCKFFVGKKKKRDLLSHLDFADCIPTHFTCVSSFLKLINLFLAALGLHCCARASHFGGFSC